MINVRRKGYLAEREIAGLMKEYGLNAYRVPLSGATSRFKGDVIIHMDSEEFIAEVKIRKNAFCRHYLLVEKNGPVSYKGIVVMKFEDFLSFTRGEKIIISKSIFPVMSIYRWLRNKDLLFFRSQRKGWLVALWEDRLDALSNSNGEVSR